MSELDFKTKRILQTAAHELHHHGKDAKGSLVVTAPDGRNCRISFEMLGSRQT